jgi:hypothetical protein
MLSYLDQGLKALELFVDHNTDNICRYYPKLFNASYAFGYFYSDTVVVRTLDLTPNCPCLSILDCLQER